MEEMGDWSYQTNSIDNSDNLLEEPRKFPFSSVVVNLDVDTGEDINKKSTCTDSDLDTPSFLRSLTEDVDYLEKQIRELTSQAMQTNIEQTLIVLTEHNLVMKMRMKATVKELSQVVNNTFETEECSLDLKTDNMLDSAEIHHFDAKNGFMQAAIENIVVSIEEHHSKPELVNIEILEPMPVLSIADANLPSIPQDIIASQLATVPDATCRKWLNNLLQQLRDKDISLGKREKLGSIKNIEEIISILKVSNDDEDIELTGSETLKELSKLSFSICSTLANAESLVYLKDLFVKWWNQRLEKQEQLLDTFWVFVNLTYESTKYLLSNSYFDIYLIPFKSLEFSKITILAGESCCNLLHIEENDWEFTVTKQELDTVFLKNLDTWVLGKFTPFHFSTFEWMRYIKSGTKSQQRYSAWLIANHLTADEPRYTYLLKKEGVLPRLEEYLADPSTNPEVAKLIQCSLNICKGV